MLGVVRLLSATLFTLCVAPACDPAVVQLPQWGSPCGLGERQTLDDTGALGCEGAGYLQVNFDERIDETVDFRRGVGANGCVYAKPDLVQVDEIDGCARYAYEGLYSSTPFALSTGGIGAGLQEPILLSKPPDAACYEPDFDGNRADLFSEGEAFVVEGFGGGDLAPFAATLVAPSELEIDAPATRPPGADLVVTWPTNVAFAGQSVLVAIRAANTDTERASHVSCRVDDATGEIRIPAALLDDLIDIDDDAWQLFALRQNWVHLEPPVTESAVAMSVDLFATTSVVRSIDSRP